MSTGRPTMLTPERQAKIAQFIAAGNDQETAALAVGVSRATFFNWMARGRAERERLATSGRAKVKPSEAIYLDFVDAIEKARAEAEARLVILINTAAQDPKTWTAAAWLLERRDPQRWGKVNRTELSGPNGGPVQSEVKAVSDADLVALADQVMGISPVIPETQADI